MQWSTPSQIYILLSTSRSSSLSFYFVFANIYCTIECIIFVELFVTNKINCIYFAKYHLQPQSFSISVKLFINESVLDFHTLCMCSMYKLELMLKIVLLCGHHTNQIAVILNIRILLDTHIIYDYIHTSLCARWICVFILMRSYGIRVQMQQK